MINVSDNLQYDKRKLKESYQDALKNKDFQQFVSKLNIDEGILMQYTSILDECAQEYDHCLNCSGLGDCKNKILGYIYLPKVVDQTLQFRYKPCRYKINQDKKYAFSKNVKYYSLPDSYVEASWDNVDKRLVGRKEVILWLNNFIAQPSFKGLYLTGNFGCGKTYLVVATFNELAKKGIKSAVIFWPEFIRNLKSSFADDYEDKIEYIKNVPLLLIDDLGAEAITPWSRDEILCPILQHRMDNNLTTFITSNFSLTNLEQHLAQTKDGVEVVKAKRIIERIKFLTEEKEMISKNMRK